MLLLPTPHILRSDSISAVPAGLIQILKDGSPYYILEGGDANYSVVLLSPPAAGVEVSLQSIDSFTVVETQDVFFSPSNWSVPQSIFINATQDSIIRLSPYMSVIQLKTLSNDSNFNAYSGGVGIPALNISVLIQDSNKGLMILFAVSLLIHQP